MSGIRVSNIFKTYYDDMESQFWDGLYKKVNKIHNNRVEIRLAAGEFMQVLVNDEWVNVGFCNTCAQCKFAHDLDVKLYSCDDDMESLVYCDKHEVMCRAQRHACDWAALSVE